MPGPHETLKQPHADEVLKGYSTMPWKKPKLCYPFSVETCDDPKCDCREQKARAKEEVTL